MPEGFKGKLIKLEERPTEFIILELSTLSGGTDTEL